jgi:hypothetical protein
MEELWFFGSLLLAGNSLSAKQEVWQDGDSVTLRPQPMM